MHVFDRLGRLREGKFFDLPSGDERRRFLGDCANCWDGELNKEASVKELLFLLAFIVDTTCCTAGEDGGVLGALLLCDSSIIYSDFPLASLILLAQSILSPDSSSVGTVRAASAIFCNSRKEVVSSNVLSE